MLVPIEWLKDYIEIDADVDLFCEKMIMSGSNLEMVEKFGEGIENVVVGKVAKIERHPDADKLLVLQMEIGKPETVQIVTGATNLFEGAYVPVALHGSRIPGPLHGQPKKEGGVRIEKGKLRGVESYGMLCSASELGFSDKVIPTFHKDGIWILSEEYPLGEDIVKALGLASYAVDFEITPNRPDCLSMIGMAREAGATFRKSFSYPDTKCEKETGNAGDYIAVEIKRPDLCKRYVAKVVKNVKIRQSPWWLQKRLIYAGMRPINNIVDITNFVMLEYGEPIHAFDIRQIEENRIVVDTGAPGEIFTTLDGNQRKLSEEVLMIKDGQKSVAIAGVMGGMNSEIKEDTTTIIIEAANFNKDSIRQTSKKLALRTEASSRFEKGIDANLCSAAADRVCKLIEMLGAGEVLCGAVDVYPQPEEAPRVKVRPARVNQVLGITLSAKGMGDIFTSLEMKVEEEGDDLFVTPNTVRQDLAAEIDYVEEVARIYGYDQMPVSLPKGNSEAKASREKGLRDLAKEALCAMGANEVQTYSFVSPKGVDNLRIEEGTWERSFVKLINPLGEENSVMRTVLLPNMLEVIGRNVSRNIPKARAFELGNTFTVNLMDENELPDEQDSLVVAAYGHGENFFTLKGMICELFEKFGIRDVRFIPESDYHAYHPGRCARMMKDDMELGILGEVHPDAAEEYGIDVRCFAAELRFDMVMKHASIEKRYKPLPKYPAMARDIALLVSEDTSVGGLQDIIWQEGKDLLESVQLFDVYRGKQVAEGKKSVAFALVYRASDRTLTEEEVAKVHGKVLAALSEKADATLREI